MAITRVQTDILWTGSVHTDVVAAAGAEESLEFNLDATCVRAQISLKADNNGTVADGDVIDFYLLQSSGDPDAAEPGTDEFDTPAHATFLKRLDTYTTGSGEDPAIATVSLPLPQKGCKIRAVSGAATNAITVSATVTEQRAA